MLGGNLPNSIFILMNFITAFGAISDAIKGLFSFDVITYLIGRGTELYAPIYILVSFYATCLMIINIYSLSLKLTKLKITSY